MPYYRNGLSSGPDGHFRLSTAEDAEAIIIPIFDACVILGFIFILAGLAYNLIGFYSARRAVDDRRDEDHGGSRQLHAGTSPR